MPRNSQGAYSLPIGTLVKSGDTVLVSQHNPAMQDIAQALTGSLARDGRGGLLDDLSANGHGLTDLRDGVADTDAATLRQVKAAGQGSSNTRADLAAMKAAPTSDITSLYDGAVWTWKTGNYAALIDSAPSSYVASNSTPGTSGAWVRQNLKDLNGRNGLYLSGKNGGGVRPEGQLQISNDPADPGHAIMSIYNQIANDEAAIEFVGDLSDGTVQQMGALFVRWYKSINDTVTKQTVWAIHGVGEAQDNTPFEVWPGFNSVRVCVGDTAKISWHDAPKHEDGTEARNVFDIFTLGRVGSHFNVGPDMYYRRSLTADVRLSVQGGVEAGQVATSGANKGKVVKAAQSGYSIPGAMAYFQGWDPVAGTFIPTAFYGSEMTIGLTGQKLGFLGAAPVVRQTVTGSLSTVTDPSAKAVLQSILAALAALGLITSATT